MASFLLRPQNGGKDILIPFGKTTIGRGPFLGVTDKRVSRSHAVLELTHGKLTVLPLHTNPTFYKATDHEKEKFVSLKKGETKCLVNGNVISLLPESLCFEVICEGSLDKNGSTEKEAETSKSKVGENVPSPTDETVVKDHKKPLTSSKEATESILDEFMDDRPSLQTCQASVTQGTSANVNISDVKESSEHQAPKKERSSPLKPSIEPAPLLQKTRKLPAWLTASETKSPAKKTANNRGKITASGTEKKTATSTKGGKTTQKSTSSTREKQTISDPDKDFIVSDDEEGEHLQQKGKRKTTSKKRTSPDLDDSDEDVARTTNKKAKRKSRDLDSESDEEDITVRPEKQDASKPDKAAARVDSSGSDDDDIKPAEQKRAEAKTPEKGKKKVTKLPVCPYGNKCYRKNPAHFKEYSHPSKDDDDDNDDEAAAEGSDDDRPECPYGSSCYRRNPQHKRDFKHKDTAGRPKRKKAKHKSVLEGDSDDDDAPNTYDYNDSFLDDGEESESSYSASDDSDWQPQGDNDDDDVDEDVNELLNEARGFLRSKK